MLTLLLGNKLMTTKLPVPMHLETTFTITIL